MAKPDPARRAGGSGDPLLLDLIALGGAGCVVDDLPGAPREAGPGAVRIGVHRKGPRPTEGLDGYDILLSGEPDAPRPWVGCGPGELDQTLSRLSAAIGRQPVAAAVAAQVLRMTLALSFEQALTLESLAYSTLLASDAFRAWRAANPARPIADRAEPRVRLSEVEGALAITLARPARRNAFDAAMRDALVEVLAFALEHPDAPPVVLAGEGPAFSAGGDLDEFGQADDVGRAHLIRTLRSPTALVRQLGDRLTVRLHGACVGAGIEVPAAAGRVIARPGAVFRLPEVSMGLIPGAGGTASISRRIGRHRAAYMAISGVEVDLATARAWGLVDEAA